MNLFNLIYLFISIYPIARIFAGVTGTKPENSIGFAEFHKAFENTSGVWWFLLPISGVFFMIYHAIHYSVWFLGQLLQLVIVVCRWFYQNIIIHGFLLLFKLLFHYCIQFPWNLFVLGFGALKDAFSFKNYLSSVIGLFVSLMLVFAGRFINLFVPGHADALKLVVLNFFYLLSIIPIGIVSSFIVSRRSNMQPNFAGQGMRYVKFASLLILPIMVLILLESGLVFLGSLSSFQFALSTLFAGGSLIVAFLILLNAVMLIFIVAALPSFLNKYNGGVKNFYSSFLSHLGNGWASYLFAVPASFLPGVLLCILPYFITQGVTYIAQKTTDGVYDYRMEKLKDEASRNAFNYAAWCDYQKISADSLEKLKIIDSGLLESQNALDRLNRGKSYLNASYGNFSSELGALPLGMVYVFYEGYTKLQNKLIYTKPIPESQASNTHVMKSKSDLVADSIGGNNAKRKVFNVIKRLEEERSRICFAPTLETTVFENSGSSNSAIVPATIEAQAVSTDYCETMRRNKDAEIDEKNKELKNLDSLQSRRAIVLAYLNEVQEASVNQEKQDSFSRYLGYFFMALWLCMLSAIAFGYLLSVFALVNTMVFETVDSSEWYATHLVKEANSTNKNQPYLGLSFILIPLMLFISMSFLPSSKRFLEPFTHAISGVLKSVDKIESDATGVNSESNNGHPEATETKTSKSDDKIMSIQDSQLDEAQAAEIVYDFVEQIPIFHGGDEAMMVYIAQNLSFPERAKSLGITGTVLVRCVINKDGSVSDVKMLSGIGAGCDEEAMRLVSAMPPWNPGVNEGNTVAVSVTIPIAFNS